MINIRLLIDKAKKNNLFEEPKCNKLFINVIRRFIQPVLREDPKLNLNNETIIRVCNEILSEDSDKEQQYVQDMKVVVEFLKSLAIENQKVEFSEEKTYATIKEYVKLNRDVTMRDTLEFFKEDQLMNPIHIRKALAKIWK